MTRTFLAHMTRGMNQIMYLKKVWGPMPLSQFSNLFHTWIWYTLGNHRCYFSLPLSLVPVVAACRRYNNFHLLFIYCFFFLFFILPIDLFVLLAPRCFLFFILFFFSKLNNNPKLWNWNQIWDFRNFVIEIRRKTWLQKKIKIF